MPLGTAVSVSPLPDHLVRPAQITARWQTIIRAGGLDVFDGAGDGTAITDATAEITESTTSILNVGKGGTTLRLRMRYDDGDDGTGTDPIIQVFGRWSSNVGGSLVTDDWEQYENKAGNLISTMVIVVTAASGDASDGTFNFTHPDANDHAWDLNGCNQILVGVHTTYTQGTGGASATATIQAKVI